MNFKKAFHWLSYLQYPIAIIGLLLVLKPYIVGFDTYREDPTALFRDLNSVLILMGLAISFSTLQDTTKTQNQLSLKIWQSPVKGKLLLILMAFLSLGFILAGVFGYFKTWESGLKELSIGLIVLGIGLLGMLKAALEMFENHRLDKVA